MAEMQNVLRFEITPSNIIFIDRNGNVQENEFEFSVIKHEKSFGSHVQENAVLPHIILSIPVGSGEEDLCTLRQARDIRVMQSAGDGDWRIETNISVEAGVFQCTLWPRDVDFTENYSAVFRFYKLHTDLQRGGVTLRIEVSDFQDVKTGVTAMGLYKEYPVTVLKYELSPKRAELMQQATLSWEIEGARNCYITGIGEVKPVQTEVVTVKNPQVFTLTAVNYKGKPEYRECEMLLSPPKIETFTPDRELVFKGQELTLSWKAVSAYQVYVEPGGNGPLPVEGSLVVHPDRETQYRLTAIGYDGKNVSAVSSSLTTLYTRWELAGSGRFPVKEEQKLNRRLLEWEKKLVFYGDMKIYTSSDGLSWQEKKTENYPLSNPLMGHTAMLADGKLFLLGGRQEGGSETGSPCDVLVNQLSDGKWSIEKETQPPNQTWGSAAAAGDVYLHSNLLGNSRILTTKRQENGLWSSVYIKAEEWTDAIQLLSFRENFYLAVRGKNGTVEIYCSRHGKDWQEIWSCRQDVGDWFFLDQWENDLYFINKSGICAVGSDRWEKLPADLGGDVPYVGIVNGSCYLITSPTEGESQIWKISL